MANLENEYPFLITGSQKLSPSNLVQRMGNMDLAVATLGVDKVQIQGEGKDVNSILSSGRDPTSLFCDVHCSFQILLSLYKPVSIGQGTNQCICGYQI